MEYDMLEEQIDKSDESNVLGLMDKKGKDKLNGLLYRSFRGKLQEFHL